MALIGLIVGVVGAIFCISAANAFEEDRLLGEPRALRWQILALIGFTVFVFTAGVAFLALVT